MAAIEKLYRSVLPVPPPAMWKRVTSADGLAYEMAPLLKMTVPKGFHRLSPATTGLGVPLFRSWLLLFRAIPIGRLDLMLVDLSAEHFVEQSRMSGMHSWRHERRVLSEGDGCTVVDRLRFEPRFVPPVSALLVDLFFRHRHRRLRAYRAEDAPA